MMCRSYSGDIYSSRRQTCAKDFFFSEQKGRKNELINSCVGKKSKSQQSCWRRCSEAALSIICWRSIRRPINCLWVTKKSRCRERERERVGSKSFHSQNVFTFFFFFYSTLPLICLPWLLRLYLLQDYLLHRQDEHQVRFKLYSRQIVRCLLAVSVCGLLWFTSLTFALRGTCPLQVCLIPPKCLTRAVHDFAAS